MFNFGNLCVSSSHLHHQWDEDTDIHRENKG